MSQGNALYCLDKIKYPDLNCIWYQTVIKMTTFDLEKCRLKMCHLVAAEYKQLQAATFNHSKRKGPETIAYKQLQTAYFHKED